jgi:pyruvate dehydrogenase E2 component (dihydrolipoamide acetyltransferase)
MDIVMPKLGLTMTEGTLARWFKAAGAAVEKGEPLFELETDKITLTVEAPVSGVLSQVLAPAGTIVPVLKPVACILPAREEPRVVTSEPATKIPGLSPVQQSTQAERPAARGECLQVKASPKARRLAGEAGLDLAAIRGTGPGGRIVASDVENVAAGQVAEPAPSLTLPAVRRTLSNSPAPVTLHTQADATELVRLHDLLRDQALTRDEGGSPGDAIPPTYGDMLTVCLARALGEFPYMNARWAGDEIQRIAAVNLGLPVETERGRLTPVLQGVERLSLEEAARASRDLLARARAGALLPGELTGATFMLTGMGEFEVDTLGPWGNPADCPTVGALGVGCIVAMPVVVDGRICVRQMVSLSLTFDHRAVDGAPAARFLQRIKHLVEQPWLALLC